jgi:CheY-like chemotaxis protein
MRLLVVDPYHEFRGELTDLLETKGHSTTAVKSTAEAIRALRKEEFDVLFTELDIGRKGGLRLLAEARKRWPRLSVVVLTEKGSVESAVQVIHAGAFDYLQKPTKPREVLRVLELIEHQLALAETQSPQRDPADYARMLAAEGGYEVLLISPPPPPPPIAGVVHLPLDPEKPLALRDAVAEFAAPRDRAAVVLAAIEELLARHREREIAKLLGEIRTCLQGKGPLAVGYNPQKISPTGVIAVRASIVAADAHTTLESLSNPIRRLVLRRLADGPATFMQAMKAAKLGDTSKISFHLRKLVESGLVSHAGEGPYELTARGRGVIDVLGEIDRLDSEKGSGNRVFSVKSKAARKS